MIQRIKSVLTYDKDSGLFTWIKDVSSRAMTGQIAGTRVNGYICISVFGKRYQAHRLAFALVNDKFPILMIDHRNGVIDDNRWLNLREATNSQNTCNSATSSRNTTGIKGVSYDKSRNLYRARIDVNGIAIRLGRFDSIEEASQAVFDARLFYHKEFANNG